jgi:hypothetical protein
MQTKTLPHTMTAGEMFADGKCRVGDWQNIGVRMPDGSTCRSDVWHAHGASWCCYQNVAHRVVWHCGGWVRTAVDG